MQLEQKCRVKRLLFILLRQPWRRSKGFAQDDAKRGKPFRSQRSIAFEDSSLALPRCNAKVTPLRHPGRKKSSYLFFFLDVTHHLLSKLVCSRTGLRRASRAIFYFVELILLPPRIFVKQINLVLSLFYKLTG